MPDWSGEEKQDTPDWWSELNEVFKLKPPASRDDWLTRDTLDRSGPDLDELPKSIGELRRLTTLTLRGCTSLRQLPASIGHLKSLTKLDLSQCGALNSLPAEVDGLAQLQTLRLKGCVSLTWLPASIGGLRALQELDLSRCTALVGLPASIGGLSALKKLDLSHCTSFEHLPHQVGKLENLEELLLAGCTSFRHLPWSVGQTKITTLDMSGCTALRAGDLEGTFGGLSAQDRMWGSLTSLDVSGCDALSAVPDSVGCLHKLQTFNLGDCTSLHKLPNTIGDLGSLQSLQLNGCISLRCLPKDVSRLTQLQTLEMCRCSALEELPEENGVLQLPSLLTKLDLSGCVALRRLPPKIGGLKELQQLLLTDCKELRQLPGTLSSLTSLQVLNLTSCSNIWRVPALPRNLEALQIVDCSSLRSLPPLPPRLRIKQGDQTGSDLGGPLEEHINTATNALLVGAALAAQLGYACFTNHQTWDAVKTGDPAEPWWTGTDGRGHMRLDDNNGLKVFVAFSQCSFYASLAAMSVLILCTTCAVYWDKVGNDAQGAAAAGQKQNSSGTQDTAEAGQQQDRNGTQGTAAAGQTQVSNRTLGTAAARQEQDSKFIGGQFSRRQGTAEAVQTQDSKFFGCSVGQFPRWQKHAVAVATIMLLCAVLFIVLAYIGAGCATIPGYNFRGILWLPPTLNTVLLLFVTVCVCECNALSKVCDCSKWKICTGSCCKWGERSGSRQTSSNMSTGPNTSGDDKV